MHEDCFDPPRPFVPDGNLPSYADGVAAERERLGKEPWELHPVAFRAGVGSERARVAELVAACRDLMEDIDEDDPYEAAIKSALDRYEKGE